MPSTAGDLALHGMVEADYTGDRDKATSTTGRVFYMTVCPSWVFQTILHACHKL